MADSKITDLTLTTAPLVTDYMELAVDPGGTPASRAMALSNLFKIISGMSEDATPTTDAMMAYLNDIGGTPAVAKISVPQLNNGVLLHDETLGAAGRFDVSSISSAYDDLLIKLMVRTDVASTLDTLVILFNNDTTTTNYHRQHHLVSNGATHSVGEGADNFIGPAPGATAPTNSFAYFDIYVPEYSNTVSLKAARGFSQSLTVAGGIWAGDYAVSWEDGGATAINRITIQPDGYATDEFLANSRMRIIGIKYGN